MAKDYVFGFKPTKVPESLERPLVNPEVIHGPRPNLVPSQDNKAISYYEEVIRLKRAMDELEQKFAELVKTEIPEYDKTNANDVLSVNDDGTDIEWKPATSASGVSASVEQTETGATITITDASGTTAADIENGKQGNPGFSPSAKVEQTTTGATVTVTDQSGTTTADLTNGKNGEDGFSPSANVEQLADNEAAIYVTDKSGTTVATVTAPKGDDGFSPEITMTPVPEGYHMKIKDATGEQEVTIADGKDGATGPTPVVTATATVTDSQGTPAVEVTKTGTDEAPAFNFAFSNLKGADGQSITGPGVAAGGTAGQILTKKSATDFDTEWTTPSSEGSSVKMVTLSFNIDIDTIDAESTVEIGCEYYVDIDKSEYEQTTAVLRDVVINAGRGDIVIAGYKIDVLASYMVGVRIRLSNTGGSIYKASSYPNSPNNVSGTFFVIGVK